jgi:hypothetical protein
MAKDSNSNIDRTNPIAFNLSEQVDVIAALFC